MVEILRQLEHTIDKENRGMRQIQLTRKGVAVVILVIVLVFGLAATIATMKQRGDQARQQEAVKVALEEANKETETIHTSNDTVQREDGALPVSGATPELPQTGASSLSIIPVGLMVVAMAYYMQSKRMVKRHNRL